MFFYGPLGLLLATGMISIISVIAALYQSARRTSQKVNWGPNFRLLCFLGQLAFIYAIGTCCCAMDLFGLSAVCDVSYGVLKV